MRKLIKCVVCNGPIKDFGHNPDPISKTGRACDGCNSLVIVARIKQAYAQ